MAGYTPTHATLVVVLGFAERPTGLATRGYGRFGLGSAPGSGQEPPDGAQKASTDQLAASSSRRRDISDVITPMPEPLP